MADVFDVLIGQDAAAAMLRQHVASPVHAYLFTGPAGSSLHDALVSFAAALQCPDNGCGTCSTCRRVLQGSDTDVYFAQRSGVSWRVDELREAERVSRRPHHHREFAFGTRSIEIIGGTAVAHNLLT